MNSFFKLVKTNITSKLSENRCEWGESLNGLSIVNKF